MKIRPVVYQEDLASDIAFSKTASEIKQEQFSPKALPEDPEIVHELIPRKVRPPPPLELDEEDEPILPAIDPDFVHHPPPMAPRPAEEQEPPKKNNYFPLLLGLFLLTWANLD